MRNTILSLLAVASLLIAAVPSLAGEASLGVRGEVARDDNIFGTAKEDLFEKDGDWSLRFTPVMLVEEPAGDLQWRFEYAPRYEYFFEHQELRGWDHDVKAELEWHIDPRTAFRVEDRFRRYGLESRFNESTDVAGGDDPVVETRGGRSRVAQNRALLELTRQVTRRNIISLSANHLIFDRSEERNSDQESYGVDLSHLYTFSPRTQAGPFLSWSRQIQKPPVAPRSKTDFLNLSLRVIHLFDPTFRIDVSAGPALVFSDETELQKEGLVATYPGAALLDARTCPTLPDGTSFSSSDCEPLDLFENDTTFPNTSVIALPPDGLATFPNERAILNIQRSMASTVPVQADTDTGGTDLTYFADITLRKFWESWAVAVGYRRSDDSSSSNVAVTSVSDRVFGNVTWEATPKLRLNFSATWLRRTQSQDTLEFVTGIDNGTFLFDSRTCLTTRGTVPSCPHVGRQLLFSNVAMANAIRGRTVDEDFESTLTSFRLSARYRLRKRVILHGAVRWESDVTTGDAVADRDVERLLVTAGVEYQFEPFRF